MLYEVITVSRIPTISTSSPTFTIPRSTRPVTTVPRPEIENTDVAVQFDITMARQADQGFFDVAVQFKDIFCSAKLDCQNADGSDLELLHTPAGARDMTVVLGFACTGSLTGTTFV